MCPLSSSLHTSGDEAPKGNWDQCPIAGKGLPQKDSKTVTTSSYGSLRKWQLSEVERTESHLLGRDVVHHDGYPLPDNTVIQWWNYRGHKDLALRNAVKHHYPVICSSNYYTYLNFPVTPWKGYTEARTFDLKDVYLNNPSDKAISEKKLRYLA